MVFLHETHLALYLGFKSLNIIEINFSQVSYLFFYLNSKFLYTMGFPDGSDCKNLPSMQETWVLSLGWEDALEKGMATHSSILAWRIP